MEKQNKNKINVEIVFADNKQQVVISLQVEQGCTVKTAIEQSGVLMQFPKLDLASNKIGIFSKLTSLDALLQAGDRIEIYQPLLIDPKQARKQRAHKQRYGVV